jgi:hypothetical protein
MEAFKDDLNNTLGGVAIAVGVYRASHSAVSLGITQKPLGLLHNRRGVSPNHPRDACFYSLRSFRFLPENENRFPHGGSFLLNPSGIRQDQIGSNHEMNESLVRNWIDQMNPRRGSEDVEHWP